MAAEREPVLMAQMMEPGCSGPQPISPWLGSLRPVVLLPFAQGRHLQLQGTQQRTHSQP